MRKNPSFNISTSDSKPNSDWYLSSMEQLISVVQELSFARNLEEVMTIVRNEARGLTGADGASFVLRDGDLCYYAEENAIAPLWKGKRFPMSQCISGWVMLNAQPAVIENIYDDARIPVDAYRPTFVKSLAMVPIRHKNPIGAIGNYWANRYQPSAEQVNLLQALAHTVSVALENIDLYEELQSKIKILQQREFVLHEQRDRLEIFTRALAHDLKEPVRTVHWMTQSIDKNNLQPEKRKEYFQYIKNAAERMSMLIDSVFQYSQLDNTDEVATGDCDMEIAFTEAQDNLKKLIQNSNVRIKANKLPKIHASHIQMVQVFQNLISNSIKHNTNDLKTITIQINAKKRSNDWLFTVSDNGSGLAREYLDKIFIPFKRLQRRDDCAGLGLSICRKIMQCHGGEIWCESKQGEGSTFLFTLPINTKKTATRQIQIMTSTEKDTIETETESLTNILLVDDMKADIELTKNIFRQEKLQCNLLVAHDAENALQLLNHVIDEGNSIECVLLDINMPGTDGFELLELMRNDKRMQHINIIMCTGSSYHKDIKKAKALGATGYMVKPPSSQKLKTILEEAGKKQQIQLLFKKDNNHTLIKHGAID